MGLFDFIGPGLRAAFTLENIIWINLASSSAAYLPPFLA